MSREEQDDVRSHVWTLNHPLHVCFVDFCVSQIFAGGYPCRQCVRDFCADCFALFCNASASSTASSSSMPFPLAPSSSLTSSNGNQDVLEPPRQKSRIEGEPEVVELHRRMLRVSSVPSFLFEASTYLEPDYVLIPLTFDLPSVLQGLEPLPEQPSRRLPLRRRIFKPKSRPWSSSAVRLLPPSSFRPSERDRTILASSFCPRSVSKVTLWTTASAATAKALEFHRRQPDIDDIVINRDIQQNAYEAI